MGTAIVVGIVVLIVLGALGRWMIARDPTKSDTRVEQSRGTWATETLINKRLSQGYRIVSQTRSTTGKNVITFRREARPATAAKAPAPDPTRWVFCQDCGHRFAAGAGQVACPSCGKTQIVR